ncbi:interleukin-2 receptor subunit beta isoform X2 [Varanus komodoensis]|uniref:interleukin-2 receptor subunit beta isoform X2 n=1 Tax=Varanus komodoensis TaxID=61221 RepID=UPI001CF7BB19|nr:interleukin-2 receptor subunit beta isoform X2 [Varanus komodoensis]
MTVFSRASPTTSLPWSDDIPRFLYMPFPGCDKETVCNYAEQCSAAQVALSAFHPAVMKTSRLKLLCILSFLLASGAGQGSASLHCSFDSMESVICSWTPKKNVTGAPCQLTASVNYVKKAQTCHLHGTDTRNCELVLKRYSLTVSDAIALVVSCRVGEDWENVQKETFKPFQNIQLRPPCNLQLQRTNRHGYNLTWSLCILSHYIRENLKYQVWYRIKHSNKTDKILNIDQDQRWLFLENLPPDTEYEAAVRAKVLEDIFKSVWSNWSMPVIWRTDPAASSSSAYLLLILPIVVSVIIIACIVIFFEARSSALKRFRNMLDRHLPNPTEFFPSLTADHEGDFQKWLSSPSTISSFHIATAAPDVSVLEIMQKGYKEPPFLFTKEYLRNTNTPENSGHSSSSHYTNGGYFFFHHLDSVEIEPCKVYFTYDPVSQGSSDNEDGDSYKVLYETGDSSQPPPTCGNLANQAHGASLQETKDSTQTVGDCLLALPSKESLPAASTAEHNCKKEGSESRGPLYKSLEQYSSSCPSVLEQSSVNIALNSNRTEMTRNGDPPEMEIQLSLVEINRPAALQDVIQNQGQGNDLCRTVSSSQLPSSSDAYLSLRDLQCHYSHHSA